MVRREHFVTQFAETELGASFRRALRLAGGDVGVFHTPARKMSRADGPRLEWAPKQNSGQPRGNPRDVEMRRQIARTTSRECDARAPAQSSSRRARGLRRLTRATPRERRP